jgi:kinesin family protein 20
MESSYCIQPLRNIKSIDAKVKPTVFTNVKKNLCKEEEFRSINHSERLHIFLKLKPFSEEDEIAQQDKGCFIVNSDTTITIKAPKQSMYFKNQAQKKESSNHLFQFSYVFQPEISQKDFFTATLLPCFDRLISGENLLIFSYGVTNSGKTYSMQGNSKNPGLIPRTLDLLFNVIKDNLDVKKSYNYKPDKFNEIISLNDNELQQALGYKENLLKMCSNFKDFDHTLNDLPTYSNGENDMSLFEASKFSFSTESLASIGVNFHVNDSDQEQKIVIPVENKYAIWISFYELYNDCIYDLLVPAGKKDEKRNTLRIREDSVHIPYVDGKTAKKKCIKFN